MTRNQLRRYLNSARWRDFCERWRESRSDACEVCRAAETELYHRTLDRVGRERLRDVVPLCSEHADEIHRIRAEYHRGYKRKEPATPKQLAELRRLGATPPPGMSKRDALADMATPASPRL